MSGRRWKWAVLLVVIVLIILIYRWCQPPGPTTKLIVEVTGGFVYVPESTRHFSIGYLNDVRLTEDQDTNGDNVIDKNNVVVCEVDQIGTELMVVRGNITVAEKNVPVTPPPTKTFNLDRAVLTFPALETANIPLDDTRQAWPPTPVKPADPNDEKQWELKYVPGAKEHHPGTTISNGWPGLLNGRMVLRGGKIRATYPSDPLIQHTDFEFRKSGASLGRAALTDKTIYEVDVPGTSIEILFGNSATSGFTRIVLEPATAGAAVKLRLRGMHAMNTPPSYANGDELKDFCSFYSLVEPRPKSKDWLTLHYMAPATLPASASLVGGGQPSPGFFCNGDF